MKTWQKRTLIGLGSIIAVCVLLIVLLSFPFISASDMCGNTIVSSTQIGQTNYRIVVFQRDCGASTDFSTQASILKVNEDLPNECGNIFIADTDHGKAPEAKGGGPELRINILSTDSIELSYDYRTRIYLRQNAFGSIKIKYSTFGAT